MNEFVEIGTNFIRKDSITTLKIECDKIYDDDPDYIDDDNYRVDNIYIIINDNQEFLIKDDDADVWFRFIETWYNIDDHYEVKSKSAFLCRNMLVRKFKN